MDELRGIRGGLQVGVPAHDVISETIVPIQTGLAIATALASAAEFLILP